MLFKNRLTEKEIIALTTRLKELRQSKNFTQQQMAKIFFISRSAWSNYETGKRIPNPELIKRIALEFETDVNYVMGFENTDRTLSEYLHRKMKMSKCLTPEGYLDISDLSTIEKLEIIDFYEYLRARTRTRIIQQQKKAQWILKYTQMHLKLIKT